MDFVTGLRPFIDRTADAVTFRWRTALLVWTLGDVRSFGDLLSRLTDELRDADVATLLVLEGAIGDVVARASRAAAVQSVSPEVTAAMRYAEMNVSTQITVAALAAAAGLSERTLSTRFSSELKLSPLEYVRRLRIRNAARLLRETSMSLGDVAAQCGFYDHAHLTRSFRRAFGLTPTEYRRRVVTGL